MGWLVHPLNLFLIGAPVAILAEALGWSPAVLFFASGLAIVPLARLIGVTTEELAGRLGSAAGGLLNATFGNATELIIAIIGLHAGLYQVVKASLIGSILGNLLPVLGLAFLLGGLGRTQQRFDRTAASAGGAQLAVAAGALLVPAILAASSTLGMPALEELSILTALILLLGYAAGLFFSLRTHAHLYAVGTDIRPAPRVASGLALAVLALATVAVGGLSELLVAGVKGVTADLGWTPTFVGVVLIALLGNAAEHASAVTVARHDRMDLALAIALGSATQVALFVAPALVLLSLAIGHPMDLLFQTFEVAAVAIAVGLVNLVIHDGESNWLEGVQLLALYAVLAAAFFVHP